jgi:7,8-dihydropterin-6-yl-methyl-4-(beta-D-ribofuranosyl)aminobenzene 5'-phosphate synthase
VLTRWRGQRPQARSLQLSIDTPAVAGGFHLAGGNEKIIAESVKDIGDFGLAMIAPGHCTGWRALNALATAYGDSVVAPLAVGKLFAV